MKRVLQWSFLVTLLAWGFLLTDWFTASTLWRAPNVFPMCRAGGPQLHCLGPLNVMWLGVDNGATAWQTVPSQYFFNHAKAGGSTLPKWNPYIGSGYPQFLDGMTNHDSIITQFLNTYPGDKARDLVVFLRIFLFVFGVVTILSLLEVSKAVLVLGAITAATGHYLSGYVDTIFLDIDLVAPWVLVPFVLVHKKGQITSWAIVLSLALGWWVGTQGFVESQAAFPIFVTLIVAAALPLLKWRALVLGVMMAIPFSLALPRLLDISHYMPFLYTNRGELSSCMAAMGLGWEKVLSHSFLISWRRGPNVDFILPFWSLLVLIFVRRQLGAAKWLLYAFAGFVALVTFGVPASLCNLPGFSAIAFYRHGNPYVNVLAMVLTLYSIELLSRRYSLPVKGKKFWGLVFFTLIPFWHPTVFNIEALSKPGAPPAPPYERDILEASPLGRVQKLSRTENRRHFSPHEIMHPNWPGAFDILDLRILNGIYVLNHMTLSKALSSNWKRQGTAIWSLVRPEPPRELMSEDFQRILILNRISLFSFLRDQKIFSQIPGPYEADRCELLSQDEVIESYRCPDIGAIGFFPKNVQSFGLDHHIEQLRIPSLMELVDLAVVDAAVALKPAIGRINSFERLPDELNFNLDVASEGLFVVVDTMFPGWKAQINGLATNIYFVNYASKGVVVPQGNVSLRLKFEPN